MTSRRGATGFHDLATQLRAGVAPPVTTNVFDALCIDGQFVISGY
jgi:hypothetical protein